MARTLDLIIFGASGFTGQYIVSTLARLSKDIKWAVAGRSEEKLKSIIEHYSQEHQPEIIHADVNDEESLKAMTRKTKVLINAVGPYRLYGEPVVKACIATSTNLVDLCGEPEFLERIRYDYHQKAIDAGCLIVESCGFDSLPADLGILKLAEQFEPNGILVKVDSFLTCQGGEKGIAIHYTTYEAAVLGFGSVEDLKKLRQKNPQQKLQTVGSKLEVKRGPFEDDRLPNRTCYQFMGSDAAVIRRTQEQLTKDNPNHVSPQVGVYFTIPKGIMNNMKMALFGGGFQLLSQYERGRNLLLKYPKFFSNGLFSHEGPTEEQMKNTTFEMTFFGHGYTEKVQIEAAPNELPPCDRQVTLRISGPEPGYYATSSFITIAAMTLLKGGDFLPAGGVYTPGYTFRHAPDFLNQLEMNGIKFEFSTR